MTEFSISHLVSQSLFKIFPEKQIFIGLKKKCSQIPHFPELILYSCLFDVLLQKEVIILDTV